MNQNSSGIWAINGGSSSIKFARFASGESLRRTLVGGLDRIGLREPTLRVDGDSPDDHDSRIVNGYQIANQHAKWLKVTAHLPWRRRNASLNYLLASHVWRPDHNMPEIRNWK